MKRVLLILLPALLLMSCDSEIHKRELPVIEPVPETIVFPDATPRFEGCGITLDCDKPGVLTFRKHSPQEWTVRDLTSGCQIVLNDNTLNVNGKAYNVETTELYNDRSETVDYIRIKLKDNQEAWLVLRKEY